MTITNTSQIKPIALKQKQNVSQKKPEPVKLKEDEIIILDDSFEENDTMGPDLNVENTSLNKTKFGNKSEDIITLIDNLDDTDEIVPNFEDPNNKSKVTIHSIGNIQI